MRTILVGDEMTMVELGEQIASRLPLGAMVFLVGELGTGKTTLARGILQGYGHVGMVTSPTYTLLETYTLPSHTVHHFDLYRMDTPAELENIGIRDLLDGEAVALVEWPVRGQGVLPPPDIQIDIGFRLPGRCVTLPPSLLPDPCDLSG